MKKKILIATATLGLLAVIMVPHAHAATKTVKKTVAKTHAIAKTSKAKPKKKTITKSTTKKKKVARVTHSVRRVAVNSPNAPLITQ